MEKRIEEMYKDLCESKQEREEFCDNKECRDCEHVTLPRRINCETFHQAKLLIAKGYRKQSEGEWIPFFEEVEIYNTGGYTKRQQTGYFCSKCKSKKSVTRMHKKFCPNCGAKMKGATE